MRRKKTIAGLEIEKMADQGMGLGRSDGMVVFVEKCMPGDVVDVLITRKKKDYAIGRPLRYISYSKDRVDPFCSHFGTCGGCKWQFATYEDQLKFKESIVEESFRRIAKLSDYETLPILGCEENTYYRNKLEFTFSDQKWLTREEIDSGEKKDNRNGLGFHIPGRFDKILDIQHCYLQAEPSNEIRNAVRTFALEKGLSFFNLIEQEGLLRNLIIRTGSTGDIMIILVGAENKVDELLSVLDHLEHLFSSITSLNYVVNTKKNDTLNDQEIVFYKGIPWLNEKIGDVKFHLSPKSFFQTNSKQAEQLYRVVRDFACLQGHETVYDLYSGIGSIGLYLASSAAQIIGVEIVEDAVTDAFRNAELNGFRNCEFFAGDMCDILEREIIDKKQAADLVVLDPPRAGLHPDVVEQLLRIKSQQIIYVSCNPATQARDVSMLQSGYRLIKTKAIDMFPHTPHIENVALLQLRE